MQNNRYIAYLGNVKSLVGKQLKPRLRIGDALNPLLEAWKANFDPLTLLLFLNPAKEVLVGFGKPVGAVLENLRVGTCKLGVRGLGFFDDIVKRCSAMKRNLLGFVGGFASLKKKVIEFTAQIKLREQPSFLFFRRIQPKVIVSQLFHSDIIVQRSINTNSAFILFISYIFAVVRSQMTLLCNWDRVALTGFPSHTTRHTGPYQGGSVS